MLSVILIGISLSMDAFAVSVTNGIAMRPFKTGYALWHGLYFGAFQFLMPLAGYILGSTVSGYVTAIGPYVSFALLAFIGGKMILEAVRGGGIRHEPLDVGEGVVAVDLGLADAEEIEVRSVHEQQAARSHPCTLSPGRTCPRISPPRRTAVHPA